MKVNTTETNQVSYNPFFGYEFTIRFLVMNLYYLIIAISLVNAASTPRENNGPSTPSGRQFIRNSNSSTRGLTTGGITRPTNSPPRSHGHGNGAAGFPGRPNSGVQSPMQGHGNVQSPGRSPALANDSFQTSRPQNVGAKSPNQRNPVSFQENFSLRGVSLLQGSNGNRRAVAEMLNGLANDSARSPTHRIMVVNL